MKRIGIAILLISLAGLGYMLFAPMGTGSEGRIMNYKTELETKTNAELIGKVKGYFVLEFSDGELRTICDDSHSSPWGGNMLMADDKQVVWTKMGHACGSMDLVNRHERYVEYCNKSGKQTSKRGFIDWVDNRK
jgi:hypothetical protein